jgi:hypothetical protein
MSNGQVTGSALPSFSVNVIRSVSPTLSTLEVSTLRTYVQSTVVIGLRDQFNSTIFSSEIPNCPNGNVASSDAYGAPECVTLSGGQAGIASFPVVFAIVLNKSTNNMFYSVR